MMAVRPSAKYDTTTIARLILEEVAELHPHYPTARQLSARIVTDADDRREVEAFTDAIRDLRRTGLLQPECGDEILEPTETARFILGLFAA